MGSIHDLLKDVPIPRMARVRQIFDPQHLDDIPSEMAAQFDRAEVKDSVRPGMRVAVTAGSRGIANLALIIRETVAFLKRQGAQPFVIPAMGSHGGATAEGQLAVIREYGVTPEYVGCPVIATMDVLQIGALEDGRPIYINRLAAEADGIVTLNRIKAHTAFRGRYESGTMNLPGLSGLWAGVRLVQAHQAAYLHNERERTAELLEGLRGLPGATVYGPQSEADRVGVVSFNLGDYESSFVADYLDRQGIAVRGGLHCAPGVHRLLGTLSRGAVRASVGRLTASEEIQALLRALRTLS